MVPTPDAAQSYCDRAGNRLRGCVEAKLLTLNLYRLSISAPQTLEYLGFRRFADPDHAHLAFRAFGSLRRIVYVSHANNYAPRRKKFPQLRGGILCVRNAGIQMFVAQAGFPDAAFDLFSLSARENFPRLDMTAADAFNHHLVTVRSHEHVHPALRANRSAWWALRHASQIHRTNPGKIALDQTRSH